MTEQTIRTQMLLGEAALARLRSSRVAVLGLGGVGSWCAEALARAGVGALTLVDEDTVSESNLNRQCCALHSTIGQPKAAVMAARVHDIDPSIAVDARAERYEAATRERFFDTEYDYIADCIDLVSCKVDLIRTAHARGIPIVSALGTGNKMDASRFELCDISQTSGCPFARVMRRELKKRQVKHLKVVYSTEEALTPMADAGNVSDETVSSDVEHFSKRRSTPGSVAFVPSVAGLIIGGEVIKDLTKEAMKKNFRRL